jgi:hypothetical protein
MSRGARTVAAGGLLAACIAALPSFEWCPLPQWTAAACEALAMGAASAPDEGGNCARETRACAAEGSVACETAPAPFCDRFPDPIPFGDKLWCIRPPVTAIVAKTLALDAPEPVAPLAVLVAPPVLEVPEVARRAAATPAPRPPSLVASHAPPQPRAPPSA